MRVINMDSKTTVVFGLTVIYCLINDVSPYRILGIFPFAAPSHYFLGNELIKGLAEAGHDSTILTCFEEKNPPKNGKYHQIVLDGLVEQQIDMFSSVANYSDKEVANSLKNPLAYMSLLTVISSKLSEWVLVHQKTQDLMKSQQKFDVVIVSEFTIDALKVLAPYFEGHQVILNNNAPNSWMNHFVGNPTIPSLNSEEILGFPGRMNFQQRLMNTLIASVTYTYNNLVQYPTQVDIVKKFTKGKYDLHKVMYNVSLVLSNSHISLSKPASSVPCMKEIGGFHVKPPKKLPDDLQKYLDEAKNGVIYFSMGSNFRSIDLPMKARIALMKAFSKRKEAILWKFEDTNMPGKPNNVRIEKWLPQSDLLAHPNIKLFITHGGFLSNIETIYHGVPTITMPIGGDQIQNAKQAELFGYSIMLDINNLSQESVSSALEEVLSNKKYRETAKERSRIFHDRQIKPIDEAVYWIEYIVRHNGAKHLRVPYLDLTWYQYYLLDVFGFIFTVIFLIIFILRTIIRWILCKLFKKTKTTKSITTNKLKRH